MRICSMAQETQTGALYQTTGVGLGARFKREGIYIYIYTHTPMADSCFSFDRKQQNSVKQLSLLKNKLKISTLKK